MPMSFGGRVESSSDCDTRPRVPEIGLTGCVVQNSSPIGHYVMGLAEHREPCDSRGSCTVLGAPGGEIPPGDSTLASFSSVVWVPNRRLGAMRRHRPNTIRPAATDCHPIS